MEHLNVLFSSRISVDSLRVWPWLFLLLLSAVTWLLPLSPAVTTLESNPRPPFSSPVDAKPDSLNSSQADQLLEKFGCNKGYGDVGDHCKLVKQATDKMEAHFLDKEEKVPWDTDPDIMPWLTAKCWLSFGLERAATVYAHHVCANVVNRLIRGAGNESKDEKVIAHKNFEETMRGVAQREVYVNRKVIFGSYNAIISYRMSFLLFIFAMVLLFPSLLWWKLSPSIWCGLNIDKTLDLLQQIQTSEPDARRKTYQDISRETAAEAMSSGKTTKTFLFCKILVCGASIAVLCTAYQLIQKRVYTLVVELEELSDIAKLIPFQDHLVFHCSFFIQQLQKREEHLTQCSISFPYLDGSDTSRSANPHLQLDDARRVMLLYGSLFQLISALLVLHATFNFCGLLGWTWKLYVYPCRFPCFSQSQAYSRYSRYAEDVRFFLYNVHEHLGHVVSRELADCVFQFTDKDTAVLFKPGKSETNLEELS
ncbi:pannexin 7 [Elysia marginata]|uniref:Pannexin 7 n=1 Tax=Elysia marginata TaxID=1093978 RepID=A0AAV4EZS2_9GAST|nr:pannexin 7 [Elysia marginata]